MNVATPVSLTQHVAALEAGEHVIAAAWLDGTPALAMSDGAVMVGPQGSQSRVDVHGATGLLVAAVAGGRLYTGGGDGRICAVGGDGSMKELARDPRGGWIDAIAATPSGSVAFSTGKRVTTRDEKGGLKHFEAPATAQGLTFVPKGYRLAIAHYNGATLWYPEHLDADPAA
jgi:hypothetical protein